MSTTTTDWRGVATEKKDDLPGKAGIRLRARSRRLLGRLVRPHRRELVFCAGMVVVQTVFSMAGPYLVSVGIDHGIPALRRGDWGPITAIFVAMVVCAALASGLRAIFLNKVGRIGQTMLLNLRRMVFTKFQALPLAFHENYTSGRVISRLTSDPDALNDLIDNGLDGLLDSLLTVMGIGIMMAVLDVPLALVVALAFPLMLLLMRWFSRHSAVAYRRTREAIAALIVHFVETCNGIRAVKAFRREPRNEEIFGQLNNEFRSANARAMNLLAIFVPGMRTIAAFTTAAVVVYGGLRAMDGDIQIGVLVAFVLYLRQFFNPLETIAMFYNSFQSGTAALEKLSGVLEEANELPEPAEPKPLPTPLQGRVSFDGVTFAYPKRESDATSASGIEAEDIGTGGKVILPLLNLDVPAGQTVALVGATGAGKSTLARLLCRFYDPQDGAVRVDGVDVRDLADTDLRRAVVIVTQENFLFAGSVADNIAFGRPDATRAEIEHAAKAIGAHTFISALPDGYDTDVKKRGGRLSAGQRQLVAFARAFIADPAVLVLDEATSSLDVPSERMVQRALRTILADRTALIIAHRLSTVEIADRVLVMEDGRIVEDGEPAALLEAGSGRFAGLHQAWRESLV
ncbi:ABC transporter ATP-binding protein [Catenulispora sp. NF23]|uniref:ABC transporter ATP-binding protein n=1 Tax=Catenulispora pinistramenti TaxID=2705254 RepID=A0ABS5KZP8_9ACTN|nr:ABC transporter ATP-binding protein [Catenulispora pinistramenti]MBS2535032.1 ABC transporter ATP-binding protein [Catenulispora pinistramenti]MBS2551470.1 ABC transporter ATP-binding protein [Catenulispora pinistramenti]